MLRKFVVAALALVAISSGASAADMYVKAKPAYVTPAYNWTGFFVGGHVGYLWGDATGTSFARNGNDVIDPKGYFAGVQAGYRYQFSNRLVLGFELSAPVAWKEQTFQSALVPTVSYKADVQYAIVGGVQLGYAIDRWLPYIGGGFGFAEVKGTTVGVGPTETYTVNHPLAQFVAGVNYGVTDNFIVGARYTYQSAEKKTYPFLCCSVPLPATYGLDSSAVSFNLEYKF